MKRVWVTCMTPETVTKQEEKRRYHVEAMRKWRAAHPEKAEINRKRAYELYCERNGIKHRHPDFVPLTGYEAQKRHRERHPERAKARDLLGKRVKRGSIERPAQCQLCGSADLTEAHHDDYSTPTDVMWLCKKCHWERHLWLNKCV